ncbi:hypothetical protein ACVIW2_005546 [Bradyrhizobium huanghuaihaiense]|uniref:Uncharacterized protein n=1 Tax=Bradyrhizobium betae TaxID=244734 RepID=A0A4V1P6R7_9BRAD|nr:hypothetical protein [Bradyrhizobium betae]RXT48549.1 hypothetical protein B5V03_11460 [Bradyrhizobium betae]
MSAIWTTAVLVALLFPGIFFFIGVATYERFSREIIRSGAVSEIALATLVSLLIHIALLTCLGAFGFRLSAFLAPLAEYDSVSHVEMVKRVTSKLLPIALYLVAATGCGIGLGVIVAIGVVTGPLRFLVKHKWAYDLIDRDRRRGITTVYVMTTTTEDNKVLMYRGRLHHFMLQEDGKLSYVILKDCARYYMNFGDAELSTGKQLDIFRGATAQRRVWDYLMIDSSNIANILFDPSVQTIKTTDEGNKALQEAIRARREAIKKLKRITATISANNPSTAAKPDAEGPRQ